MKPNQTTNRRQNYGITKRIIELHESGFVFDFEHLHQNCLRCIQDNLDFQLDDLSVIVVDQVYDQFTRSIKYVHSIETSSGYKGVLLCDFIYTLKCSEIAN